jgi:5-methylcytosine-specific restriction protein B
MSRYNPGHKVDAIYAAVELWRDKCLLEDGAVLSNDDEIWTPQFFDELDRNFIQNPDEGSDKFYVKLKRQLANGSDESKRLMAEVDWILMLFSSNILPETKRRNVGEVWSWSGGTLDSGSPMLTDDALSGLGSSGMGYNTNKWREIAFAILSFAALKSKSHNERKALLEDPWAFASWLDEQPDPGNRQFRHILLHLVFPDSFERISTSSDKLAILNAYDGTSMKDLRKLGAVKIDEALKDLRGRMKNESGEVIDFYLDDIKAVWKRSAVDKVTVDPVEGFDASDAKHFLSLCLAQSGDAHVELGFSTQDEAFDTIAEKFGTKRNTVKNNRDNFDSYTDSSRVGWKTPLRPALQKVWSLAEGMSREEILQAGRRILESEWEVALDEDEGSEPTTISDRDIFGLLNAEDNLIKIRKPYLGSAIIFSNTHKRTEDAWFVLTGEQIRQSLQDILENLGEFSTSYHEATWRGLFAKYLSDDVARYMGAVQTFPLFEVLSKIVHYSGTSDARLPKTIDLTKVALERAIEAISNLSVSGIVAKDPSIGREAMAKPAGTGQNLIFYGAPGTGKSHKVDGLVGDVNVVRTVFHPDTQNSDFFGCLKPRMKNDKVTYGFVPGPFSYALRAALRDPAHQHFLVVEELNRAPAAAVFGELFQLLDRKDGGEGAYKVDFPNDESRDWYNEGEYSLAKLLMPSNLSIIATMNSADHGVYPLDTAFRRRWEQEYLPLEASICPEGQLEFSGSAGSTRTISWRSFVKCLNDFLINQMGTAEDRLLGQWFVQERELSGQIPAKILLYLWDDLLRHEGRGRVFAKSIKTFGGLDQALKVRDVIFGSELLVNLEKLADPVEPVKSDLLEGTQPADGTNE